MLEPIERIELPFTGYKSVVLAIKLYRHMVLGLGIEPRHMGLQPNALPLSYPSIWSGQQDLNLRNLSVPSGTRYPTAPYLDVMRKLN